MLKLLLAIFVSIGAADVAASPLICPPALLPDSQTVDPACPGIGAQVFGFAGSHWLWGMEDVAGGDNDFNDLIGTISFDATATQAMFTYLGASALKNNTLIVGGISRFNNYVTTPGATFTVTGLTPGAVLPLEFTTWGLEPLEYLFTPSNRIYAACESGCRDVTTVPEPGYFGVIGLVTITAALFPLRRRR